MQKFLLIVLLAACLALALAIPTNEQTLRRDFTLWMKNHAKSYSTDQFQYRFQVWKRNALWIEEFNQRNATTYQVAMNEFGDLTSKEFGRIYNGLLRVERSLPETIEEVDVLALPSSVDWRKEGLVTGIKNQQQCGSCWAFSTTGSMEGAHARTTGKLISLSEQNLVDCSSTEGNEGCNGGLMDYAFEYIIQNKGIDTEASYPYTAEDGTCTYKKKNCASTLAAYTDVQAGSESALQAAVAAQGPISVAIDASHSSFQFYSGGVYYEANCSPTSLDHGVLAVGYGTQSGKDYWIVKNSWGADWGLKGYILMSRNRNNNCGIATAASFPQRAGALACP